MAGILAGWFLTIATLAYGYVRQDTLTEASVKTLEIHNTDKEQRLRALEGDRIRIAEMKRDVVWIKKYLIERNP